jgi:hypothetical protein
MKTRSKMVPLTAALLVGSVALAGCSAVRDTLGSNKYPPDEFMVVAKTPLIIPPEYNLNPPGITNPHPREVDTSELAMRALFPETEATGAEMSAASALLLQESGANAVGAGARSNLNSSEDVVGKGSVTESILYDDAIEGSSDSIERRSTLPLELSE